MYTKNVCLLNRYQEDADRLYTAHFVLETKPQTDCTLRTAAMVRAYYVCEGEGRLHTLGETQTVKVGDLFFTPAGEPFALQEVTDLKYMYIGFLGGRGNQLLDRLHIDRRRRVFHRMQRVGSFWLNCLSMSVEFNDVLSECALLYAFACIDEQAVTDTPDRRTDVVLQVRKAIEDGFSRSDLSLETLAEELSYNPKYLSSAFKKGMGVGVVEYLQALRVRHACAMMEQGFRSIADIAQYCGFNDPQYFSKVFKKHTSLSPAAYAAQLRK